MRVAIPDISDKADRFSYLRENKNRIIKEKKSSIIEGANCGSMLIPSTGKSEFSSKQNDPVTEDVDRLKVKTVANTHNWLDFDMDVLLKDCAKKSINERKGLIPHIHDHIRRSDAKVGEVDDITLDDLTFKQLGLEAFGSGITQCIVFVTEIIKSYNEKIFNQYKEGRVNQHSIGLQYVQLALGINDPEDKDHFDTWEKHFDKIINKQRAIDLGFFWGVSEIKLIENSTVLFGANEITPTLDNDLGKSNEPAKATHEDEPPEGTQQVDTPFKFHF